MTDNQVKIVPITNNLGFYADIYLVTSNKHISSQPSQKKDTPIPLKKLQGHSGRTQFLEVMKGSHKTPQDSCHQNPNCWEQDALAKATMNRICRQLEFRSS